jgi:hypothetical protein
MQSNRPGLHNLEFERLKWALDRGSLVLAHATVGLVRPPPLARRGEPQSNHP